MSVKVHHLNCGTLRPYGLFPFSTIPLFNTGRMFRRGLAVIHCLLLETASGLILVDTGYGVGDYLDPTPVVRVFNTIIGLEGNVHQTALHQINALGYSSTDVTDIFLTHMHLDHTGGLADFPHARVHAYDVELETALRGKGVESQVYINQHRAHDPDWHVHQIEADRWHGLACTPPIEVYGIRCFFVPMVGHSPGHCLVVMNLPDRRWVIHAGDAYGYHGQIDPDAPFFPPYHRLFRPLFFLHPVTRSFFIYDEDLRRLRRELGDELTIFCAHDPHEYQQLSGQTLSR